MYSLLLVDDEKTILDGLYYNIDWSKLDIRDTFRAADVPTALDILEKHHIDIIITDIRMPGFDGLTLCETILNIHPYTKIIILSGYRDFEYAQRAIDTKVYRYILKPVEYEELEKIASEALTEIKRELKKSFIVEEARKKIDQIRPFLQERFLNLWLEEGIETPWIRSDAFVNTDLKIAPNDYGFVVTVKVDNWISHPINSNVAHIAIKDLAYQLLSGNTRMISYHSPSDNYNLLFLNEDLEWFQSFFKKTIDRLEFFQLSITESLECTVSIFWDFPAGIKELAEVYQSISERIRRRMGYLPGGIIGPEAVEHQNLYEIKSLRKRPSLLTLMNTYRRELLMNRVTEVFHELRQPEYQTLDNILQIYHAITGALVSSSLQRSVSINKWWTGFKEFFENSNTITSLDQFEEQCYGAINQYMAYLDNMQLTQNQKIVDKIKKIIEEQYSSEISVSSLSASFNYSSNYLSRIFKLETGIALQDYIIHVRIEKAKILLDQGIRVSDVSVKVGYDNFPHFSRLFKKVVGMSPKQYQVK